MARPISSRFFAALSGETRRGATVPEALGDRAGARPGLSNEEGAAAPDVSLAAAQSRIHRGRMQLRARLEGAAPGHE